MRVWYDYGGVWAFYIFRSAVNQHTYSWMHSNVRLACDGHRRQQSLHSSNNKRNTINRCVQSHTKHTTHITNSTIFILLCASHVCLTINYRLIYILHCTQHRWTQKNYNCTQYFFFFFFFYFSFSIYVCFFYTHSMQCILCINSFIHSFHGPVVKCVRFVDDDRTVWWEYQKGCTRKQCSINESVQHAPILYPRYNRKFHHSTQHLLFVQSFSQNRYPIFN